VSNDNTIIRAPSGVYPVILKITYSDDLKIPHQFIDNNQLVSLISASQSSDRERGAAGGGLGVLGAILGGSQRGGEGSNVMNGMIILAAIVAVIVIAVLYIRRRRSRSRLRKLQASKAMAEDPFLDNSDT
jgi:L-aminopeptidase/D-esterase-like protein